MIKRGLLFFYSLICTIVFTLSFQTLLPWSYYTLVLFISAIVVYMLYQLSSESWLLYMPLIILGLILINIYNIVNNFRVIPLYDSYHDYATVRIIMEKHMVYPSQLVEGLGVVVDTLHSSSWPIGAIFAVIFSLIMNIDVLHTFLTLPSAYYVVTLLFIALFPKSLFREVRHMDKVLAMTLLLYVISPDAIYDGMVFYHRFHALVLYFMALYLVTRDFCLQNYSRKTYILHILLSTTIAFAHPTVSYVYTAFLFYFITSVLVGNLLLRYKQIFVFFKTYSLVLPIASLCIAYLWNSGIATIKFSRIIRYSMGVLSPHPKPLGLLSKHVYVPEALPSSLMQFILKVRDFGIYLPALAGLLVFLVNFLLKRDIKPKNLFLIYSITAFTGVFIVPLLIHKPWVFVTRYFMPFIIFFASFSYTSLLHIFYLKRRKIITISISFFLIFLIFIAFIAPWSHRYSAGFLYDPSITFKMAGVYDPSYLNLKQFIVRRSLSHGLYLSDAPQLLYVIMQPRDYRSIRLLNRQLFGKANTYIFTFIDLNPLLGYVSTERVEELRKIKSDIHQMYNKLLDSKYYAIYVKE